VVADAGPASTRKGGDTEPAARVARAAGLVYVSDRDPGFSRVRSGRGFRYLRPDGRPLRAAAQLRRIARLAIPPAYQQVWICRQPRGHMQATGRDARGRKQYRYHPQWRSTRDGHKFERIVAFATALPKLRERLRAHLALPGLPREKVIAVVVSLLDTTRARIGNAEYARDNQSYGLTTLRNRHVRFLRGGRARLTFPGKGGLEHDIVVDDARLLRIVRRCKELPGQQLFQYVDDAGKRCPITSGLVNDYLREAMGTDFTAKDFRTWAATLRAIVLLAGTPLPVPPSTAAYRKAIAETCRHVAADLRNTPAVCRKSYISPVAFKTWRSGALHRSLGRKTGALSARRVERRVLQFLRKQTSL
jgi:DNA topoisomerase IB